MGYRASWIAVDGASEEALLRALRWQRTGEVEADHVDPGMVVLRRGAWAILFADGSEHYLELDATDAAGCATEHPVLFLSLSDTMMGSELRCFDRGREVWSVVKDAGAPQPPTVTGSPPAQLAPILARLAEQQAGETQVDYWYEAAPELGRALTGFRHDDPEADAGFAVVRRAG